MTEQAKHGRPPFSPWLAEAVGPGRARASQCEDTRDELVVLGRGLNVTELDPDWWTSGERLTEAVATLDDPGPRSKTYRDILTARHAIIHGLWIEQPDAKWMNMMRIKSTKGSHATRLRRVFRWAEESLAEVTRRFNSIERMASDAIFRYMGLA